jgi:methyl-accepting chemotaxis protein
MIKGIQEETRVAVQSMEDGVRHVEIGGQKAAGSGEALKEILGQIATLNLQISQIATAAEEQTSTTHEINATVQRMTDEVSKTAHGAQSAAEAASRLSVLAEGLERLVGQFKLSS